MNLQNVKEIERKMYPNKKPTQFFYNREESFEILNELKKNFKVINDQASGLIDKNFNGLKNYG